MVRSRNITNMLRTLLREGFKQGTKNQFDEDKGRSLLVHQIGIHSENKKLLIEFDQFKKKKYHIINLSTGEIQIRLWGW